MKKLLINIILLIFITVLLFKCNRNHSPTNPIIIAPDTAGVNIAINFTVKSTDSDNDDIAYRFFWGDGTGNTWSVYYPSEQDVSKSHTYSDTGTYIVMVKAKDTRGKESNWATQQIIIKRVPPEPYWTWTTEDSTQIQHIVNQWHNIFKTSFGDTDTFQHITSFWDTIRGICKDDMRTIWMRPHYWPRAFKRTLTRHDMYEIFTPVKDTTVLVQLIESIAGTIQIQTDSCTVKIGDTTILGDTFPLYTRHFIYSPDTLLTKNLNGISTRYFHFKRDSNGAWKFSKTTGGARIFLPSEGDAPTIFEGVICSTGVKVCTVMTRPDTTHYGMQRLFNIDSILSFSTTETINVRFYKRYYIYEFDPLVSFGFWHYEHQRRDLRIPRWMTRLTTLNPDWQHIMLEIVPWDVLCKRGDYNAILWSILIKAVP
jgi:hypothetical protein